MQFWYCQNAFGIIYMQMLDVLTIAFLVFGAGWVLPLSHLKLNWAINTKMFLYLYKKSRPLHFQSALTNCTENEENH